MKIFFSISAFFVVFAGCTTKGTRDSGAANSTENGNLTRTEFVPTLENKISGDKNVVYCPSLLYAWDLAKQKFKDSISLNSSSSTDFKLINESLSFRNSLDAGENTSETHFSAGVLKIRSFFSKSMPYISVMQKLTGGLVFDKAKVSAFGMNGVDKMITFFTKIVFYDDDDHFVIKITPEDNTNEILLVKGLKRVKSLGEALSQTQLLLVKGQKDLIKPQNWGKYTFTAIDTLAIPVVQLTRPPTIKLLKGKAF